MPRLSALLVLALLVAGCRDRPAPPPRLDQALPGLPLPPEARITGRHGSADALQISFESGLPLPQVLAYYRDVFSQQPWNLVSDEIDRDGVHVLYVERDGPPMWVRLWPSADSSLTLVEISGAVTAAVRDSVRRAAGRDSAAAR